MPRGGARPGAGRKPKNVEDYRRRMELTLLACVAEDDWAAVVQTAIRQAKDGDAGARAWLSDRVMGKVRDEIKHQHEVSGPGGGPIQTQSFDYDAALAPLASRPVEDR